MIHPQRQVLVEDVVAATRASLIGRFRQIVAEMLRTKERDATVPPEALRYYQDAAAQIEMSLLDLEFPETT